MTHPGDCKADAASAALAAYRPGTAARVTFIPATQVGVQGSQTGYTPRKQQRTHQDECPSCGDNTTWHFLPRCMLAQL